MDYAKYQDLKIRRLEPGILEIVMGEEGKLSTATARMHQEKIGRASCRERVYVLV